MERNQKDRYADERISQASIIAAELNGSPSQTAVANKTRGKTRQMDEVMGTVSAIR